MGDFKNVLPSFFFCRRIMTGRTNYWSTLLMCYFQQWGIIIRWCGCWDLNSIDYILRLNVKLRCQPVSQSSPTWTLRKNRYNPGEEALPPSLSNLQYFFFCLIFFLLDNTLKGGDQVRRGFSSQNIPTPLKTIQKALLLFCLSLTTVVIKSVK